MKQTPHFDPSRPLVVRRKFTSHGRHYKPGDMFTWKDKSISQRIVMNLYNMGTLRHAEEGAVAVEAPVDGTMSQSITGNGEGVALPEINQESPYPKFYKSRPDEVVPAQQPDDEAEPEGDELDAIDDMKELRAIANAEGAKTTTSKAKQRELIRENRKA